MCGQGGLWKSLESLLEKYKQPVRHERDAKSQDCFQEISSFCHELKKVTLKIKSSFFGEHVLCISDERTVVFGNGLLQ